MFLFFGGCSCFAEDVSVFWRMLMPRGGCLWFLEDIVFRVDYFVRFHRECRIKSPSTQASAENLLLHFPTSEISCSEGGYQDDFCFFICVFDSSKTQKSYPIFSKLLEDVKFSRRM